MGKRRYREWTPTEEARLLHWMVLHPDSEWSWDTRAEKYSKTIRPRTAESLRSKLPQGMTAKQARKEQQRTRDALPLTTTGVPLYRTHTKFRDIGAGPEEVERGGQAVPTAELSGSSPMNQVGKSPVRGKALVRSVQDWKTSSLAQQPVRGPSRTMDLVWQLVHQFAGRTRPRPSSHPRQ
ncbi:hypothetical protein CBS147326_9422 [Penicillium roqueforti]|nr:hypothetical protein CBS147326_9422 [Penicillium roqueforti]